jgi:hypothetical protein
MRHPHASEDAGTDDDGIVAVGERTVAAQVYRP